MFCAAIHLVCKSNLTMCLAVCKCDMQTDRQTDRQITGTPAIDKKRRKKQNNWKQVKLV